MSNSGFPWFPFYARDWLTDVQVRAMQLSVRGAYVDLLALQWENGGLPEDPEQVRQLLGVGLHAETWPAWWSQLERHFPVVAPEDWLTERRNPRLEELRAEKLEKRRRQSEGGRSSAAKQAARQAAKQAVRASDKTDADADVREEKTSVRKRTPGGVYPTVFGLFWNKYPKRNDKRVGKKATLRRWKQLGQEDRVQLLHAVKHYSNSKIARVDGKARDPERFLKDDYWRDWLDGPGTDVHVEERDRIKRPEPQADTGGPPVNPSDVVDELGYGSLREATRGLGEAFSMDEKVSGDLEKEGGGLTKQEP